MYKNISLCKDFFVLQIHLPFPLAKEKIECDDVNKTQMEGLTGDGAWLLLTSILLDSSSEADVGGDGCVCLDWGFCERCGLSLCKLTALVPQAMWLSLWAQSDPCLSLTIVVSNCS